MGIPREDNKNPVELFDLVNPNEKTLPLPTLLFTVIDWP
jgi:hypothetical protein